VTSTKWATKTELLGIPVFTDDRMGICRRLCARITGGDTFQIVTLNALMVNHAFEKPAFFGLLKQAECVNDSVGISIASLLLGLRRIERFQGIELFYELLRFAEREGIPVFIYGARELVNASACENIKRRFSGLNLCGRLNGYAERPADFILEKKPRILFVALDSPRQEEWIYENIGKLNCVAMGIGGSLDVVSGRLKRAGYAMRFLGAEWLFRVIKEPWRIRRILNLPVFLFRIIKILFVRVFAII